MSQVLDIQQCMTDIIASPKEHQSMSEDYLEWKTFLLKEVEFAYEPKSTPQVLFGDKLDFTLPYRDMGNINTTHLYGVDEVIILSFYLKNRYRYRRVLDLGANIGLHSIVLGKLGVDVTAYEADPETYVILENNIRLNGLSNVSVINSAVASYDGTAEFTRVCGNLTGSHLSGAKDSPYGELEKFSVDVVGIGKHAHQFDFIKMDIEGQEADVFCSIPIDVVKNIDIMMEINGDANAQTIFNYANIAGVNLFLQNNGWEKAKNLSELPRSHREGSVFVSQKQLMPW